MRYIPLLTAGILLNLGNLGFAAPARLAGDPVPVPQPPPLDQPAPAAQPIPATQPVGEAAVPAAQPAQAEGGSIFVLPFVELSASSNPWVSRAIQQDLVVDLVRATRARVQAPANVPPAADAEAAIQAGRQAGASHVVYGQLQSSGGQMRATGQVLDVATGKAVDGFNATAPSNDLFPLEDSVAGQVLRALPAAWVTVPLPPVNSGSPAQGGPQLYATTPPPATPTSTQEYYSYTYPDYASGPGVTYSSTYWGYPYYWYAVPYYGPDFYFFGGGWDHFHHHYWGHGWDHGYYGHYYGGYHPFSMNGHSHGPSYGGGGGFHGGGGGGHAGGGGHGR